MKGAGLEVWVDAAGNIHGRRRGRDPSSPIILFGSHIDSVPKGGNFDGNVGSMAALEVMLTLHAEQAQTKHTLEMVVWAFEDSGKGLFGSRSAAGGPDLGELELTNEEGLSVAERLRRLGLDPDRIDTARIRLSSGRPATLERRDRRERRRVGRHHLPGFRQNPKGR